MARPSRLSVLLVAIVGVVALQTVAGQSERSLTLTGSVVDADTDAPLSGAHVFISRSMIGTTTDEEGSFRLTDVPLGASRLYVSMLGYENKAIDLHHQEERTLTFSFKLEPEVIEADPVSVTAERDEEWYERLRRFKRHFIGESKLAEKCTLRNPEVLRFETKWWGKFEASAQKPLVIENRALGYKLTYFLKEFEVRGDVIRWDGDPFFTPLTPQDSIEARRWKKNRIDAYRGSLRHFLQTLLDDRIEEEEFQIQRLPRANAHRFISRADKLPVGRDRILDPGPDSTHLLNVRGRLEVIYRGEPESEAYLDWAQNLHRSPRDYQTSQIELNQRPIHIDPHGEIVEPYGATLYQYFAFTRRMAQLLPREYRPSASH